VKTNGRWLINLCFHGVGSPNRALEPGEERYWITEEFFLRILDLIADRPDVGLSFDDGNQSDREIGLPALVERGLLAGFFPIACRLDRPGSLSEDDLRTLVSSGMSVGTHGMYHQSWRTVRDGGLVAELETARSVLSSVIGAEIREAACPLGDYDRRVLGELCRRGYAHVLTSDRHLARSDSWLQPRFSVRAGDDVDSIRLILSHHPSVLEQLRNQGKMLAKRWR